MATVKVKKGDLEGALDQLRKICKRDIVGKYKENQFYTKPGDKKRKRKAEAVRAAKRANKSSNSRRFSSKSGGFRRSSGSR